MMLVVRMYRKPINGQEGDMRTENEAKHTSQRGWKASRSGNDALASAAGATSLELDRDILTSDSGVGGEDLDDGGEGVHL